MKAKKFKQKAQGYINKLEDLINTIPGTSSESESQKTYLIESLKVFEAAVNGLNEGDFEVGTKDCGYTPIPEDIKKELKNLYISKPELYLTDEYKETLEKLESDYERLIEGGNISHIRIMTIDCHMCKFSRLEEACGSIKRHTIDNITCPKCPISICDKTKDDYEYSCIRANNPLSMRYLYGQVVPKYKQLNVRYSDFSYIIEMYINNGKLSDMEKAMIIDFFISRKRFYQEMQIILQEAEESNEINKT